MTTNRAEEALRAMGLSGWPTIDPYLVWAWLTDFRDYFAPGTPRTVAVAIECRGPDGNVADLEKLLLDQHLDVKIPRLYTKLREAVVSPKKCRFCTAIANVDSLPSLVLLVTRLELGTAITEQQEQQAALTVKPSPASAVVGVIDDFVAFAHPCFAVDDHSRLTHVWSQEPVRPEAIDPTQWVAANEVGYGFELTSLPSAPKFVAPSLATLRDAYPTVMPRVSHGTPVACLAAGNRRDLQPPSSTDVIAVHLPKRVVDDTSGGAFNVQALDGIRYIIERAGATKNAVVNLSYGTMAGPHDGTSILERAIDELVDRRAGQLAVVLPAGNAYEARGHACVRLTPHKPRATLKWVVPPECRAPSFLEVWLPTVAASLDVGITVTDPAGRSITALAAPSVVADAPHWADATFGVVYLPRVANGEIGTMILIALAPTGSMHGGRTLARHGVWSVVLESRATGPIDPIHAWIERDDTLHGRPPRGRQSRFVDEHYRMPGCDPAEPGDDPASLVQRGGSFNTFATGKHTIVVGGYAGRPHSRRYAPGTGAGPMRGGTRCGPDVNALAEESRVSHGVRVAANGAADTVRANGTSVAAPQVTRIVATLLAAGPLDPTAIRDALAARTCHTKETPDEEREGAGRLC
jgi:subtilisin family serine protease